MSVWVDPARLKTLANKATDAATAAESQKVDDKVRSSCDGLPGSSLQWAARQVATQLAPQVRGFASSAHSTADNVAGAAKDYRMTDEDAAAALDKAWPTR